MNEAVSVMIASAQSVAKVFVIGAAGGLAVRYPDKSPFLPASTIGTVARFSFHILLLPLIYGTTARTVSIETIGDYWFVMVAAFYILSVSYVTATCLGCCLLRGQSSNPMPFEALRIAATFPNIVALPILIFPSLCEYPVVYENFLDNVDEEPSVLQEECEAMATTMIFCYFFAWSLAFWTFGHPRLMHVAKNAPDATDYDSSETPGEDEESRPAQEDANSPSCVTHFIEAVRRTFSSPGFCALLAGFLTGCIPPLQRALFAPGGALRFLGDAVETLGRASSPMSTLIVAATLLAPTVPANSSERDLKTTAKEKQDSQENNEEETETVEAATTSPNLIMSDPDSGPADLRRRSSLQRFGAAVRRTSTRWTESLSRELRQLLVWFTLSRLILAPALVILTITGLDCTGVLADVHPLSKLVVMVNASVPGAQVVVVLLKSNDHTSDAAAIVSRVYLPTYLISVLTIAIWTAVSLLAVMPDDEGSGSSLCPSGL